MQWPLAVVLLIVVVVALVEPVNVEAAMDEAQAWMDSEPSWGVLAFVVASTVLMSAIIPEAILGVVAANLFGFVWGSIWFCISGLMCTVLVFFLTRRFLQGHVQRFLARHHKLRAIEHVVSDGGLRLLCVLRLLPFNPALMSYALATTRVTLLPYLMASLCMIPGWVVSVYFGQVAIDMVGVAGGSSEYALVADTLKVLGLVFCVFVMIYVARLAARDWTTIDQPPLPRAANTASNDLLDGNTQESVVQST
ncbi:MAG: TVP38/TMEM64 family protein [Acidiferrobacterales bacterium]